MQNAENRRSFLKHVMTGSAVIAGIAVLKKPAGAGRNPQGHQEEDKDLYRETEDFRKYYETLRS